MRRFMGGSPDNGGHPVRDASGYVFDASIFHRLPASQNRK
jgi:hypothetical protein